MHFTKKTVAEKRSNLISKLQSKKLLRFPGAYNPLCAKLIAEIGFDGVYVSGGVMSNDLGLPDIGLTSLDQVSYRSGQIARVTDLPTIVDIDTGFGNCKKTIEVFEAKGLAGCHLEDQVAEKRCGHLDNKELISLEEMVKKIEECVKSRKDKNFLIIARTDANTVEGLDKTINRIKAYESAGADMIFGHGPHVLRAIDIYKGRIIAYSLGNFATYARFNLSGLRGLAPLLKVKLDEEGKFISGKILLGRPLGSSPINPVG